MRKLFLLSLCFSFAGFAYSQDIIVKTNGKQIKSKMIEVAADEIKFKLYDINDKQIAFIKNKIKEFKKQNLDATQQIISIPKKDVFFIEYENGNSEIFKNKIPIECVDNVANFIDMDKNPNAYKSFRNARKRYSLSTGLISAGGALAAFGITAFIINSTNAEKNETNLGASYIYMGTGVVLIGTGLPLFFNAKKKMNTAFDDYKNSLKTSQNFQQIKFGITQHGFGMNVRF